MLPDAIPICAPRVAIAVTSLKEIGDVCEIASKVSRRLPRAVPVNPVVLATFTNADSKSAPTLIAAAARPVITSPTRRPSEATSYRAYLALTKFAC